MPNGVGRRRLVASLVAIGGVLLASPVAGAESSQDRSSVAQYLENVPTSTGGGAGEGSTRLPPAVLDRLWLEGGSDAPLLEAIATQKRFGASPAVHGKGSARGTSPSAASAALSAVTDADSPHVVQLLLVLLATTAAALAATVARARRGRRVALIRD